jgi:hypothetical protein
MLVSERPEGVHADETLGTSLGVKVRTGDRIRASDRLRR